jgi:hypothetical protein
MYKERRALWSKIDGCDGRLRMMHEVQMQHLVCAANNLNLVILADRHVLDLQSKKNVQSACQSRARYASIGDTCVDAAIPIMCMHSICARRR